MNQFPYGTGLHPKLVKKRDKRNFIHSKSFGAVPIEQVPNDFIVSDELELKNQGSSDECTSFAASYILDSKLKKITSPEYIFQKEKLILGGNYLDYGGGIDAICKEIVRYASILKVDVPPRLLLGNPPTMAERNATSNPTLWPPSLDNLALLNRKFSSYFEVTADGYMDRFDAGRATMYDAQEWLLTACYFQPEWITKDGIVPETATTYKEINPHMTAFKGTKTINGKVYWVNVPSWGDLNLGGQPYIFFPREVINSRNFLSIRVFRDLNPADIKAEQWNLYQILIDYYVQLIHRIEVGLDLRMI